ncbi:aldehyde dehydrogenase (NAD+) [Microbotryum lychnidis-dioicae p1A1 Lamole]|uniref:Aldehyde dehydrogenase (NAD+) n=1 Tax=Microbotryum lychnidis-dioicae (strain p1A1 Lamole / MvSl-1064) TaxID=683840 RepID=U5HD99_USTV1|nr:aldehyde dehydrogenase (NAD+) [Microbotryum lychnidis-dioicae p1A1 Lamole]|eukprot:KDE04467.1 aldehyde dehydrogenase (NAD+) [Microbotryum lychnidis-dioicae p1A1 Lamole]
MTASPTTIKLPSNAAHPLRTQLFINNEWVDSLSSQTFSIVNPATAQEIAQVSSAQKEDVDLAVQAARKAFKTTWGKNCLPGERTRLLNKLADLIERDAQLLGELESVNGGKGVRVARDFDIGDSVACLRYYAGWTDKIAGETIEVAPSKVVYTTADPIGVCGQIIPWNYPIMMWAWKVGPALAAGCTIVMKPSELTPLTALAICDLIVEAGFPAGVVNCVPGLGASAGAAIANHMDIDKIAFTGSVQTGRTIMAAAALSNLKKVTLELGGKSPNIIFSSADLQQAANWSAMGVFYNSGQDCCAGTRLYVQEDIYDEFMEILVKKARACAIGDPLDETTSFGPLISAAQRDKVLKYIESGVEEGAKIATGGQRWPQSQGFYVEPTILTECRPSMKVVREEIFGPVLLVSKFKTEEEALELANDSVYGLGAAVFTNDAKQSMRVAHKLEAGTVWCNLYGLLNSNVPFGGYKMSGIGRELGSAGVKEYCIIRSIHHNISEEMPWPV